MPCQVAEYRETRTAGTMKRSCFRMCVFMDYKLAGSVESLQADSADMLKLGWALKIFLCCFVRRIFECVTTLFGIYLAL